MPLLDAPQVGEDAGLRALLRRLGDLETLLKQVSAAAAGSQGQLDFLAGQTQEATADGMWDNPSTGYLNPPFDPDVDASMEVTTGSTGRISVACGGQIMIHAAGAQVIAGIDVDVISAGVSVYFAGMLSLSLNQVPASTIWVRALSVPRHIDLNPNQTYTVHTRHSANIGAGGWVNITDCALSVTKLGM